MVNGRSAPRQTPVRIVIYFLFWQGCVQHELRASGGAEEVVRRGGAASCRTRGTVLERARLSASQKVRLRSAAVLSVTFAVTAVGVAHGRHGSREIIYTFTRHACNNAATAMPGPWTQRQVRDSEKLCDQSAHRVLAYACTQLPPPAGVSTRAARRRKRAPRALFVSHNRPQQHRRRAARRPPP